MGMCAACVNCVQWGRVRGWRAGIDLSGAHRVRLNLVGAAELLRCAEEGSGAQSDETVAAQAASALHAMIDDHHANAGKSVARDRNRVATLCTRRGNTMLALSVGTAVRRGNTHEAML
jgi:hypothetical protein